MAGETPGANKHHQKRRKLPWNDDRSTDKIYASGNPSALGDYRSTSDAQANGVTNPTQRADDRSADKYYAVGGSNRRKESAKAGTPRPKLGPPPPRTAPALKAAKAPKAPQLTNGGLIVNDASEVNGVLQDVIAKLQSGQSPLVLYVKAGDNNLLRRTRAALEMLVTREVITEEQYHDVRLSYEPGEKAKAEIAAEIGAPAPAPVAPISTDANEEADLDAFLSGESVDDPVVDTAAEEAPVEVDTTDDPAEAKGMEFDDEDDGDASSFLAPAAPAEAETPAFDQAVDLPKTAEDIAQIDRENIEAIRESLPAVDEAPVEDEAPAEEAAPKKKGRKSGRGS